MNKGMEDPDLKKKQKEAEKKNRRRKREKEEEDKPKVKLGLDVDVEGPKVVKRPPKRGGCTSSGSYGISGPGIKVGLDVDVEPGRRKKEYEVVVTRPVKEGERIGPNDVGLKEVNRKGSRTLDREQVVGRLASRDLRTGETMKQGMTK